MNKITSLFTSKEQFHTRYFVYLYDKLPNEVSMNATDIDIKKFDTELVRLLGDSIKERNFEEVIGFVDEYADEEEMGLSQDEEKTNDSDFSFSYVLDKEVLIRISWRSTEINIYFTGGDFPHRKEIMEAMELSRKVKKEDPKFYMTSIDNGGYINLKRMDFKYNNIYSNNETYNDDLIEKENLIDDFIKNGNTGLMLFHGIPGAGKTSYIKSLIDRHKKVKFIYMPNQMFSQIEAPSFVSFFSRHPGSIIVIEDGETLLKERNDGNVYISTLLNLTDGLLGEALRIKVVCTFNCGINEIDSALKRKGRLKFSYEFKELGAEKSNELLKKLGHDYETKEPMPLTDIINYDKEKYQAVKKNKIGFASN